MADTNKQLIRNISNGPRYVQADAKKPAIAIMPGKTEPATAKLLECADVKRLVRVKHLRIDDVKPEATGKAAKRTETSEGGDK